MLGTPARSRPGASFKISVVGTRATLELGSRTGSSDSKWPPQTWTFPTGKSRNLHQEEWGKDATSGFYISLFLAAVCIPALAFQIKRPLTKESLGINFCLTSFFCLSSGLMLSLAQWLAESLVLKRFQSNITNELSPDTIVSQCDSGHNEQAIFLDGQHRARVTTDPPSALCESGLTFPTR